MQPRRAGPQRRASAAAFVLLCAAGSGAVAAEPAADCQARRIGDRVVGTVELRGLLDADSLRLLQLGMKGRIHVSAEVVRRRWGIFEQNAGASETEAELSWTAGKLVLGGRPQSGSGGPITLERVAVPLQPRERAQTLTLRLQVQLRVVTASSLSKVAAWATESTEEDASSSVITRGLLSAVANDLTRTVSVTCPVEPTH